MNYKVNLFGYAPKIRIMQTYYWIIQYFDLKSGGLAGTNNPNFFAVKIY